MVIECGKTVLYSTLDQTLYGTLRASLQFYRKLTEILVENGYKINQYDWSVANKEVNVGLCTVLWHVDSLKWSHLIDDILTAKIKIMNKLFCSKDAPLAISCGKIQDYLGITLDYSLHDKVKITMLD